MTSHPQIKPHIPDDHSRQVDAAYYIAALPQEPLVFLDLGAGAGDSMDVVARKCPQASWIGVDIEHSPEVSKRTRTGNFLTYDGVEIPVEPASVDVVYSRQVFEHVRSPEALMRSIVRVLKPGGRFVGSVSQLEPFHSFSYWNFTYFGFCVLAADAGLELVELRPGIDAMTLIDRNFQRGVLGLDVRYMKPWFRSDSPLNARIDLLKQTLSHRERNLLKLQYAGHFCFWFQKPAAA